MSDQRLFLMEFLVSKIKIDPSAMSVPQFQNLGVHLKCGRFLDLDIVAEEFGADRGIQAANGEFKADIGKTFLFPLSTEDMVHELGQNQLEISLMVSKKPVGSSNFTWRKEFIDMIQIFESIGVVKSVNYEGNFEMINTNRQKVGSIVLGVKMSCLGDTAETLLNLQTKDAIFINPKTLQQMKCDKYEFASDKINPISFLYNPAVAERPVSATRLSWTQLFGGKPPDAKSLAPPIAIDDGGHFGKSISRQKATEKSSVTSAFDIVSMCFRPPENKFFDFLNMLSADVETRDDETIVNIAIDRAKRSNAMFPDQGKGGKRDRDSLISIDGELTEEWLNKKLCCNDDCEALQKFYQYEIGPKYRASGLGCYYEIEEPSTSYGMYHVFENFSRYGPSNFYRRPKDPYQEYESGASKYHGPQRIRDRDLCYCPPLPDKVLNDTELCCCCLQTQPSRLRGGGEKKKEKKMCRLCKHIAKKHPSQLRNPLRLRGGGIIEKDEEKVSVKVLDPDVIEIIRKILEQATI